MQRQILVCDGPGCGCEQQNEAPGAWLKLLVVGGHDHQAFDFCPGCAAKLRALMPAGPERPERTTPAPPPLELEHEETPVPAAAGVPDEATDVDPTRIEG